MIHERKYIPAVLVLVLFAGGCSLELRDFSREMFLETLPARRNQVLSAEAVPSVLFRADILRSSAEKALSVGSARGTLPGSRRWEGNRLSFFPDEPLTAGTVYFLNIIGTLTDREGRIYPVKQSIPFFSGSETGEILKISEISPPSGSTLSNSMTHLEVRFSLPVLRASMEEALYLVPKEAVNITWDEDSRVCSITPKFGWRDHTSYSLSFFQDSLMSAGGLTLSETVEYVYLTDLAEGGENSVELTVVSIDMVQDFPPAVPQPEKLSLRETVEMGFSRPVDRDTIESFFSIDPYCPGSLIWKNDSTAVFLPDRDFIPDTVYTLQIGGEFPFSPEDGSFTTAAEMPGVHSLQGDPEDQFPENLQALPEDSILITPSGAQGAYTFFFTYDEEVPDTFIQQELQHRFRIAPLFPTDIPPPATVGYIWSGPASLVIQVNGIGTLHENRPCYYTLTLPEGSDRLRQIYVRFEP